MAKSIPKVSGMDWIVDQFSQETIEPDEFTTEMVMKKTNSTRSTARHRLRRMYESGELTNRKILLDGKNVNVYKRAE
jgi:response regulator of citrate/malate metabolism